MTNPSKKQQPPAEPSPPVQQAAAAEWLTIESLTPWDRNPRKHSDDAVSEAIGSLRRFGFCATVVVWKSRDMIVAGHARLKGMRKILDEDPNLDGRGGKDPDLAERNLVLRDSLTGPSYRHVPVRLREFRSKAEAEAYALRDNNAIGDWDKDLLPDVIGDIREAGEEVSGLGWDEDELDKLLDVVGGGGGGPGDKPPPDSRYAEQFGVIVICADAAHQEKVYNELKDAGHNVKVVVT